MTKIKKMSIDKPKPSDHILQERPEGGWSCDTCGHAWKRQPSPYGCPSVPWYDWETAPENLRTTKQLRAERLKPGGPARGCIRIKDGWCYLYDKAEAVGVREMSEAQKAALAKARARARLVKCSGCHQDVDREFFDYRKGLCWSCLDRIQIEESQARSQEAEAEAVAWARARLAEDERCVILDTETSDLDDPEVIELAVLGLDETVLFNQRIRPNGPVSESAQQVHGITLEMLADCPTFPEIYPALKQLLAGKTVVTYNAAFDMRAVNFTCQIFDLEPMAEQWECAMEAYALYYGEWSDYFGAFKWQPLYGGGHSALGDCRAALERIKRMAAHPSDEEQIPIEPSRR